MHKVISGIKAIQFERFSTNQVQIMEPDNRYINQFNKSYVKLLAIRLNEAPIDGDEEWMAPDITGYGTTLTILLKQ